MCKSSAADVLQTTEWLLFRISLQPQLDVVLGNADKDSQRGFPPKNLRTHLPGMLIHIPVTAGGKFQHGTEAGQACREVLQV